MSSAVNYENSCPCGNTHEPIYDNGKTNGYDGVFFVYGSPYVGKDACQDEHVKLKQRSAEHDADKESPSVQARNQHPKISELPSPVEPSLPPPPPPPMRSSSPSRQESEEFDSDEENCMDPRAALAAAIKSFHKSGKALKPASERKLGPKIRRPLRRSNTVGPTSGTELYTQVKKLNFRSPGDVKTNKVGSTEALSRPQRTGYGISRSSGSESGECSDDHGTLIADALKQRISAVRGELSSSEEELRQDWTEEK